MLHPDWASEYHTFPLILQKWNSSEYYRLKVYAKANEIVESSRQNIFGIP